MNEIFGFLRMLWRVKGGYELEISFNPELDRQDFIFCMDETFFKYTANIYFILSSVKIALNYYLI